MIDEERLKKFLMKWLQITDEMADQQMSSELDKCFKDNLLMTEKPVEDKKIKVDAQDLADFIKEQGMKATVNPDGSITVEKIQEERRKNLSDEIILAEANGVLDLPVIPTENIGIKIKEFIKSIKHGPFKEGLDREKDIEQKAKEIFGDDLI